MFASRSLAFARVAAACGSCAIAWATTGCGECRNDRDCIDRYGSMELLCVDGTCAPGEVDDAPTTPCTARTDCDEGNDCVDGSCVVVPTCMQLFGNFVAVREDTGATGEVAATTDGCELALAVSFDAAPVQLAAERLDDGGEWVGPVGFTGGQWLAAERVGVLVGALGTTVRFGTIDYACASAQDCRDQVHTRCRTPCQDGTGCAGACDSDGLCDASERGQCR
jgi:hypothetical protein